MNWDPTINSTALIGFASFLSIWLIFLLNKKKSTNCSIGKSIDLSFAIFGHKSLKKSNLAAAYIKKSSLPL
jgi:hypothetical protein